MRPLFSIITVTYNAADVLRPTMESVARQSCTLYEHILVDGASTDDTLTVARLYGTPRLRVHSEPDHGIYDAMNRGLRRAQGDYVIFLNAGDSLHAPDTLQRLADAILEHDYPGVVYGRTDIVDARRQRLGSRHLEPPARLTADSFQHGMLVCHQAFVALRKLTEPYDLRYSLSADYDWCIRILRRSRRNLFLDRVLIDYLNEGATTRRHMRSLLERFTIMRRHYGTLTALRRHIGFIPRMLRRHL